MELKRLVVIGQGYVGLPIALRAVEAGWRVVGIDIDPIRVDALAAGRSYVEDVSSTRLRDAIGSGNFTASACFAAAAEFDVAVITVPTPLREGLPDLSMIEGAALGLAPHIRQGAIVVLESTTYPGTTRDLVAPILDQGSGLHAGVDYSLGYSPERIDPGNLNWTLVNTPKVVAGLTAVCLEAVVAFYKQIVHTVVPVSSCEVAELTKLLENTFRHVNIALVNELAMFAKELNINLWEAIDAASTKPFGYMRFTPGPGVGGHCLPVDPSYLSWQVKRALGRNFRFVELANDVNDHMPHYVVSRITTLLNESRRAVRGSRLLLLGLAYKKNTSDARESPAIRVAERLVQLGAEVRAIDPYVQKQAVPSNVVLTELSNEEVKSADLVVLLTDHDVLVAGMRKYKGVPILDTRDCLSRSPDVELL